MSIGSKKITFIAEDYMAEEICPRPYPASKGIPEWFKNQLPYEESYGVPAGGQIVISNNESNASFKKCQPMLDALTFGYIFPLWADVQIEEGEIPVMNWRVRYDSVFTMHGNNTQNMETPPGYSKQVFKYNNKWHIKTPPGYSTYITSPSGYPDSPFKAISAVIDTDKSVHEITVPVWVKDNFSGIVEKGTPMFQAIPFKRETWDSEFDRYEVDELKILTDKNVKATIVNNYIKNVWTKKSFK